MAVSERWEEQEAQALDAEILLETLARQYGYDLRGYERSLLLPRMRDLMIEEGRDTFAGLRELIEQDETCLHRTVRALCIRRGQLFDDPQFYRSFRDSIIPVLRTYPSIRIWQPACSTGLDAISLAIVLHEEGLLERTQIYATEISDLALEQGQSGRYDSPTTSDSERYRACGGISDLWEYFRPLDRSAVFKEELRGKILFAKHGLATDQAFNQFHVIVARYVLMYLNPALQVRVQRLFSSSLVRFGFLCLGQDEAISRLPHSSSFTVAVPYDRIYRRLP